jgi:hypothetical protein
LRFDIAMLDGLAEDAGVAEIHRVLASALRYQRGDRLAAVPHCGIGELHLAAARNVFRIMIASRPTSAAASS